MRRTVWLLIAAGLYFSVPVTARAQQKPPPFSLAGPNAVPHVPAEGRL